MQFALKSSEIIRGTALAVVAASCLSVVPAEAQSLKELMQDIGIQERDPVKADYNERAPLVIPPSLTALPPPETDQPVGATNWPADPDVMKELADERARATPDKDLSERLSVEELREHRRSGTNNDYKTLGEIKDSKMTPAQLKATSRTKTASADAVTPLPTVEPERKRLSDPPPGYRVASPAQPYEAGMSEREKKMKKSGSWLSKLNPFD
jgi:hypothetical protein